MMLYSIQNGMTDMTVTTQIDEQQAYKELINEILDAKRYVDALNKGNTTLEIEDFMPVKVKYVTKIYMTHSFYLWLSRDLKNMADEVRTCVIKFRTIMGVEFDVIKEWCEANDVSQYKIALEIFPVEPEVAKQ